MGCLLALFAGVSRGWRCWISGTGALAALALIEFLGQPPERTTEITTQT